MKTSNSSTVSLFPLPNLTRVLSLNHTIASSHCECLSSICPCSSLHAKHSTSISLCLNRLFPSAPTTRFSRLIRSIACIIPALAVQPYISSSTSIAHSYSFSVSLFASGNHLLCLAPIHTLSISCIPHPPSNPYQLILLASLHSSNPLIPPPSNAHITSITPWPSLLPSQSSYSLRFSRSLSYSDRL